MIEAKRFDDNKGNRFYWFIKDGKVEIASGITTVFGEVSTEREAVNKWKENNPDWKNLLNQAASYGTIEHGIFEDIMKTKTFDKNKLVELERIIGSSSTPRKDILAFMRFSEEHTLKPIELEKVLIWTDPEGNHLAMTMDCLCEILRKEKIEKEIQEGVYKVGKKKGQPKLKKVKVNEFVKETAIIDWKSNFFEKERKSYYETHKMQLIGTKRAVEQNLGVKVDNVYNWSPNNWLKEPGYTFYRWDITQEDEDLFDLYWKLAVAKKINAPQGRIFVTDFKDSKDYRWYNYKEYVEKFLL